MKTAHLGRRLGDWLGIVPEDEIPDEMDWSTPADLFDVDAVSRELPRPVPEMHTAPAPPIPVAATIPPAPPPAPRIPDPPAPSPVRLGAPIPEPAKNVLTFRDVVNQRRAATQRRDTSPHAPTRW